jgi:glycosyltransferase involved in cell wall biosynthesis
MRLLHTEASLGWGGQEIRTFNEALALRARGHQLFFAIQKGAKLASALKAEGFEVIELNFFKRYWLFSLPRLLLLIKKHKIQLIITHSSLDAWLGGIAARIMRRFVLRVRHVSTPTRAGLNAYCLFNRLADFIMTTSSEIIKPLSLASGKPLDLIQCIPTGVNHNALEVTQEEIEAFKRAYNLAQQDLICGSVCVVRSWKGIDTFIEAAHLLKDETHLKWLIVGGGYLKEHQEKVVNLGLQNSVIFTGHLDDPKIALAAIDIFLLLSTANEGISQATLQASYLQKPLVTTPTGGLKEICLHEQTGFIVPVKNPEAVKEAVLRLKNDQLRFELGQKAKQHIQQSYLFEKTLQDVEKIYLRFSC